VFYTFFLFIELTASPQLNRWIYGYHQSQFIMAMRAGGYRPMVFMRHGLNVAFFNLNGYVAVVFFLATLADVILR